VQEMRHKLFLLAVVAGPVLFLDQLTKQVVARLLFLHESVPVIPKFFSFTYIRNPGAAFGVFAEQADGFRTLFFLAVSLIAIVLLLYFLLKVDSRDPVSLVALALLFGGAVGNLLDRIRLGEVIDFLDFYFDSYHWPAFNVADSAITIGISLLVLDSFIHRPARSDSDQAPVERMKGSG